MRYQNESRKGIRKVPGFRSDTLWKKIIAIIAYVIIAIFAVTALTEDGLPGLLFFIALLAIPLSLIALIKGGLRSIGIPNRKIASLVLVMSLVLLPFLTMFMEAPAESDIATDDVASAIEETETEPPEEPETAIAEPEVEEADETDEASKETEQIKTDEQTGAEAEATEQAEAERIADEQAKAEVAAAAQQAEEERLAKETEAKAEEERLAREAEEKAAAEAAAEKAEQERIAAEAAAKEQAEQEAKAAAAAEEARQANAPNATVTRVVDGDTLEVSMNGTTETVRLLLVDTPETVHPSEPVQPFGPEASQFVKDALEGKEVRIEVGAEERDKYDRMLAYVYIGDETIQEKLLKNGLAATAYLYNDLSKLDEFHAAQQPAIDADIGVWSIPGYAHVDHDHGFHYEEAEPEPEPEQVEPEPESAPSAGLEYDPAGPDRDCGDFSSQAAAQAFMEAAGDGDRHRLDGNDNDGLACESLG